MSAEYHWIKGKRYEITRSGKIMVDGQWAYVGPSYPALGPAVQKFRRRASTGDRREYGQAVLDAVAALQRRELHSACKAGYEPTPRALTTSIARLSHYESPLVAGGAASWRDYHETHYAAAMRAKHGPDDNWRERVERQCSVADWKY